MTIADQDLPDMCLALIACHPAGERIVVVRRGRGGYWTTDYDAPDMTLEEARKLVDELNEALGVSEDAKGVMILRSMSKWETGAQTLALH